MLTNGNKIWRNNNSSSVKEVFAHLKHGAWLEFSTTDTIPRLSPTIPASEIFPGPSSSKRTWVTADILICRNLIFFLRVCSHMTYAMIATDISIFYYSCKSRPDDCWCTWSDFHCHSHVFIHQSNHLSIGCEFRQQIVLIHVLRVCYICFTASVTMQYLEHLEMDMLMPAIIFFAWFRLFPGYIYHVNYHDGNTIHQHFTNIVIVV